MAPMSIRPWRDIDRAQIAPDHGRLRPRGREAPVSVQTMTNTTDLGRQGETTTKSAAARKREADIIRVSCPDVESTAALREIVRAASVPIVADIHFHYSARSKPPMPVRRACA